MKNKKLKKIRPILNQNEKKIQQKGRNLSNLGDIGRVHSGCY